MKRHTLLLLLVSISSVGAMGQINCSSGAASVKLVCEFPFATGLLTNDSALGQTSTSGTNSLISSAQQVAQSIDIGIATRVSQLPLASASGGTILLYNAAGVQEPFSNLGPILTDRAQTIGKRHFFIGFTASQFVFTNIDGFNIGYLPFSFVRTADNPTTGAFVSNTYTGERTNLNFRLNQFVGAATYGITNKVDLSVIVPVEHVSISAIIFNSVNYVVDANNKVVESYTNPQAHYPGTADGVGDISLNLKARVWGGERAGLAASVNVRVPTGDDLNLLGSGAWGFNPYVTYSYLRRLSPHLKVGYQWNTPTELNNPINSLGQSRGNKALPGGMQYDAGFDFGLVKRLTVAGDLLGSQFLNTPSITVSPFFLNTNQGRIQFDSTSPTTSSYTVSNLSTGLRWRPAANLVLSGNVLFQLNNTGLRSRPTPLFGISYKF